MLSGGTRSGWPFVGGCRFREAVLDLFLSTVGVAAGLTDRGVFGIFRGLIEGLEHFEDVEDVFLHPAPDVTPLAEGLCSLLLNNMARLDEGILEAPTEDSGCSCLRCPFARKTELLGCVLGFMGSLEADGVGAAVDWVGLDWALPSDVQS